MVAKKLLCVTILEMKTADTLRELGYRLTPQRMMILSAIESSDGHISAEEIYSEVRAKYPYANISTVYRTLELLKNLALVTQTDLGEGIVRYHSQEKGHHHHLICKSCGRVEDLPESALFLLRDSLLKEYKFKAEFRHMAIFGYCQSCLEKK